MFWSGDTYLRIMSLQVSMGSTGMNKIFQGEWAMVEKRRAKQRTQGFTNISGSSEEEDPTKMPEK